MSWAGLAVFHLVRRDEMCVIKCQYGNLKGRNYVEKLGVETSVSLQNYSNWPLTVILQSGRPKDGAESVKVFTGTRLCSRIYWPIYVSLE